MPITRAALQLAPFVFVRPGELRKAEWTEFDLDAAQWRIPAGRMKRTKQEKLSGVDHVVPLSSQAMTVLRELHPLTGHGRYLFPSPRTSAAATNKARCLSHMNGSFAAPRSDGSASGSGRVGCVIWRAGAADIRSTCDLRRCLVTS